MEMMMAPNSLTSLQPCRTRSRVEPEAVWMLLTRTLIQFFLTQNWLGREQRNRRTQCRLVVAEVELRRRARALYSWLELREKSSSLTHLCLYRRFYLHVETLTGAGMSVFWFIYYKGIYLTR